ncbi:hypothetical protein AVEN_11877-1 [Araneus ventricosus]|uniref:Uncharacterized protein n=1 Tax=Araneus ventricosus TaxID=182803 RepID=A0A4Y2H7X3_ARAVE|nr:hypothetical protein AVEN_11877-1 [Araneus ventricosus]
MLTLAKALKLRFRLNPPMMLKKLDDFTARLEFVYETFGPVTTESGGRFIHLCTKDPEEHFAKFLKEIEYFAVIPKWERPVKVVVGNLPRETGPHRMKDLSWRVMSAAHWPSSAFPG